ncbi:MAG TPA: hypothetical protein VFV98_08890 [Vicinamibacterales bacterium]|nr:hypothetical protein [Vicinamibacterales bacterium]
MANSSAGYSGTPLVKKLGIKPGSSLVLLREPEGFRKLLVGLPDSVRVTTRAAAAPDLTIWFVTRRGEMEAAMAERARGVGQGLWVAWPKKSSGVKSDLTEDHIRNAGLAYGIVDYKVCAISEIWSGLKFARRKA